MYGGFVDSGWSQADARAFVGTRAHPEGRPTRGESELGATTRMLCVVGNEEGRNNAYPAVLVLCGQPEPGIDAPNAGRDDA